MDIYGLVVCVGLLCLFCVGADVTPEDGCEQCGCCVQIPNTTTCGFNSGVGYEGYCFNGCKTGFWGNRCYHKCDKNCVACARSPDPKKNEVQPVCTDCPDGKYLGPNQTCTLSCRKQCLKCSTDGSCSECKTPYFNTDTITNCSAFCPANCICDRYDHCSECKTGYYDVSKSCPSTCPGNCEDCESATRCIECIRGRYGNTCELNCSSNCVNGTCSVDDGSCICKPFRFYDSHCLNNRTLTAKPRLLELFAFIEAGTLVLPCFLLVSTIVVLVLKKRRRNNLHEEDVAETTQAITNIGGSSGQYLEVLRSTHAERKRSPHPCEHRQRLQTRKLRAKTRLTL